MNALFSGYLTGLALIIFLGPVFFTLLKSSLQYGFKAGFTVALGIFVSDVIAVALCLLGAAAILESEENKLYVGIAGTIIAIFLGIRYLVKPALPKEKEFTLKSTDYLGFFAKGFLVNFVNPFVFVVWLYIINGASSKFGHGTDLLIYMSAALLGILTTDSLKALFADRLSLILKPALLTRIYRLIGLILIVFGIVMLYKVTF